MRSGGLADLPAFARLSGAVEGGPVSHDDDAADLALAAHLWRSTRPGGQDLNFSSGQLQSTATARGAQVMTNVCQRRPKRRIWTPQATPRVCHDALSGKRPSFDVRRAAPTGEAVGSERYMLLLTHNHVCINLYYQQPCTSSELSGWTFRRRNPPDKGHRRTELDE